MKTILSRLARTTPARWYLPNKLTRMQLIQHAIDELGARCYLEIGVDRGEAFCAVRAAVKIGVDPVPAQPAVAIEVQQPGVSYEAMTSDDFFARRAPDLLAAGVDVVFVDGLHTYDQTLRDVTNALRHLNDGGVIFVHDCLPASTDEARVAPTYQEARRLNGPGWNGLWTGDGWKAIVSIRSGHAAGQACVLNCDHGVGVVYKSDEQATLSLTAAQIDALDYEVLARDPERLLGLSRPVRLKTILRTLRKARRAA